MSTTPPPTEESTDVPAKRCRIGGDGDGDSVTKSPVRPRSAAPQFKEINTFEGCSKTVAAVQFSPDGSMLAAACADKTVRIFNGETGEHVETLLGHTLGVSDVSWSFDSAYVCSASDDCTIRIFDCSGLLTAKQAPAAAESNAAEPSQTSVDDVTNSGDKQQLVSKQCLLTLQGHSNFVLCAMFNPLGNLIASGSYDETIRIWDVRTGDTLHVLLAHSEPVTALDFSRDSTFLVSCSFDALCRVWDTATGQCIKTIIDVDNPALSFVRLSRNSLYMLVSTLTNELRLYDIVTGLRMRTFTGHKNKKLCAFSSFFGPEGRWVIAGSEDNEACVWDLQTQELVERLPGHQDSVIAIGVHPDPQKPRVATASLGTSVAIHIWEATNPIAKPKKEVQDKTSR